MNDEAREIVRVFAADRPFLKEPSSVFNRCQAISQELIRDLSAAGVDAELLALTEGMLDYADADPRWLELVSRFSFPQSHYWIHYAVLVGDEVVDLTFRQFDPDVDVPRILALRDVAEEWGRATVERNGVWETLDLGAAAPKAF